MLAFLLAGVSFALLWATSFHPEYGYFIDELYYLACAERPALGYVDHPPLAPFLLALSRSVLGESIPALRLLPALCAAATVFVAVRIAVRMGGGRFAQVLTAICVMAAPVLLSVFSIYTTNCFEVLCWTLVFALLLQLCDTGNERLLWGIGSLLGLAVLSKHTSLSLAVAVGVGLLATPLRGVMLRRHFWIGAGLFVLLLLPNLVWQMGHGWASLEFYRAVDGESNLPTAPLMVLLDQVFAFNPLAVPVWAGGLSFLLFARDGRPYRAVGISAGILLVALVVAGKSRPDRIMGIYAPLFAVGSVQLESFFSGPRLSWLRPALAGAIALVGLVVAPLLVPVVAPGQVARLVAALGESGDTQREVGSALLPLPLAHRMGNRELVAAVSQAYRTLRPFERGNVVILAESYAPAGALELLGVGLPPVYSPHNSYFSWGPPPAEPETVIAVGFEPEQLRAQFGDVRLVARTECRYCMGWRRDVPIVIARWPRRSLRESWPASRRFGLPARKRYLLEQQAR